MSTFWNTEENTDVNHFELRVSSIDYYSRDSNKEKLRAQINWFCAFFAIIIIYTLVFLLLKRLAAYVLYVSYERTRLCVSAIYLKYFLQMITVYSIHDEYTGRIYTYLSLRRRGAYETPTGISGS